MTASQPTAQALRVSLRDVGDIVATLPYHLGFAPRDSVCLLGLAGRRVAGTARVDVPPVAFEAELARAAVHPLCRTDVDRVAVVAFSDEREARPFAHVVLEEVRARDLDVAHAVIVRDGRWSCLLCAEDDCCPPGGRAVPEPSRVPAVATYVGLERSPLASRDELVALLEVRDPSRVEVAAHLDRLLAPGRRIPLVRAARAWRRLLLPALNDPGAPPQAPAAPDVALAALAMRDHEFRDAVISRLSDDVLPSAKVDPDLARLVRRVPTPVGAHSAPFVRRLLAVLACLPDSHPGPVAEMLTVGASALWGWGEPVLAMTAVERALETDPDLYLAQLLERLVGHGVDPAALVDD